MELNYSKCYMSCKYCELKMRPIGGGLKVLKGENWTDECNEGGYIEQFYDDKFRMHINYDAGYAYTSVDNIKYCPFCGAELTMPKEPLIKDDKLRNIIKEWCEYYHISKLQYRPLYGIKGHYLVDEAGHYSIDVDIDNLKLYEFYNVDEVCGEEIDYIENEWNQTQ